MDGRREKLHPFKLMDVLIAVANNAVEETHGNSAFFPVK
jgi:hypothetical protein